MRRSYVFPAAALCLMTLASTLAPLASPARAVPEFFLPLDTQMERRLAWLERLEAPLRQAREALAPCRDAQCLTPAEATVLAHKAGPGQKISGRFILDVRAGGRGDQFLKRGNQAMREGERLFFLSSERYRESLGVLTIAIKDDALDGLVGADGSTSNREILSRFRGQRVIVDGEVGLEWIENIDFNTIQRNGTGYNEVWVRVSSPDQITVVGPSKAR